MVKTGEEKEALLFHSFWLEDKIPSPYLDINPVTLHADPINRLEGVWRLPLNQVDLSLYQSHFLQEFLTYPNF